jgi:hypothetical protein
MEARKKILLAALFYPLTVAMISAGLIAAIMIIIKVRMLVVATVVFWFYWVCVASIYLMSRKLAQMLEMKKLFLGFFVTTSALTALATILLVLDQLGVIAAPP